MSLLRHVIRVPLTLFVISLGSPTHLVAQSTPSGLLVGYALDETSGTVASDASGNGYHGTLNGSTRTPMGEYGAALSFDGVNDRIDGPSITLGTQFTLMAWVRSAAWSPYETVLSVGRDRDLYARSGVVTFFANERELRFGTAMAPDTWHHVALTADGGVVRAYVNGANVGSATMSMAAYTGQLRVGAWSSGASMDDYWSGSLDEVRVYSRVLSQAEVQTAMATPLATGGVIDSTPPARSNGQPSGQLASTVTTVTLALTTDEVAACRYSTAAGTQYAAMVSNLTTQGGTSHSAPMTGLTPGNSYSFFVRCQDTAGNANTTDFTISFNVAAQATNADWLVVYPMDDGSGDVVRDVSGRGNDAVRGGATWTSAGRFGSALAFDGVNDVVTGPSLALGNTFTFMAWVYKPVNAGYETILTVGSSRNLFLANGALGFFTGSQDVALGQTLSTQSWQHVAVTYDGATLRAYLNGAAGPPVGLALGAMSGIIRVGAWNTSADFLQGVLDEVRVYTRALSAGEVGAAMNATTEPPQPPDTTPPVISLTSPGGGTVVSGSVTIAASATDDRGVAGVQFAVDGQPLGPEDTSSPYATTWDSTTAAVGSHTIQAIARDAAGNRATATATVSLPGPSPAPGYAVRFTGSGFNVNRVNIRLDAPARPIDVGGDFTLEWWMKVQPGAIQSQTCRAGLDGWIWGDIIFDRDVYYAGDHGDFGVSLYANGLAFGVARGTSGAGLCGSVDLATGVWRHVAVTRRASDGRLQIFVDGRLITTGSGPAGDVSYRNGRATQYPGTDPYLVIGAEKHNVVPPLFTGLIDEVRVSTIIRYSADFARPTQPFVSDNDTVALYHFDEGQGTAVGDSSDASGGPSDGTMRVGGSPSGPAWVTDTPFN
ncbi:MAG: LamG-like jellyroll fold domain-containing protein [Vicinamibacterales bacterium]